MPPRFRTEHVGSLIRPDELVTLIKPFSNTTASVVSPELRTATRKAVKDVLAKQIALKWTPMSNGEYPRDVFFSGMYEALGGFTKIDVPLDQLRSGHPNVPFMQKFGWMVKPTFVATSKISWDKSAYLAEWEEMKSVLQELAVSEAQAQSWMSQCKLTMPTIAWEHFFMPDRKAWSEDSGYTSNEQYFEDLAAAYRKELRTLYDAGLRNVQFDDPALTFFAVEDFREAMRKDGVDPDGLLKLYAWAHNLCIKDLPSDMHVGIHLCRGNAPGGTYMAEGSYENVAKTLFQDANFHTYYLEYDTERAGGFEPLAHLPKGKNVILGVVSTKTMEMENLDELEKKVRHAAETIAAAQNRTAQEVLKDQIGVSPQCGFSSGVAHSAGGYMTEKCMWEKIQLLQKLARRIWPDEFS